MDDEANWFVRFWTVAASHGVRTTEAVAKEVATRYAEYVRGDAGCSRAFIMPTLVVRFDQLSGVEIGLCRPADGEEWRDR